MSDSPVNLTSGIPETVLTPAPAEALQALNAAMQADDRHAAVSEVVAANPTFLEAWARLSETAARDIEAYAYARVGYHRGLDALRRSGWKGSGYVRWREETNQGFLRCVEYLRRRADAIGETDEAQRCDLFLRQLDPEWRGVDQ